MTDPAAIERGTAAYAPQQMHLLGWLADWRDQYEFDIWAADGAGYDRVHAMVPGAFVLGTPRGGPRDWWLDLLQHMVKLKRIEMEGSGGIIRYRAVQPPPAFICPDCGKASWHKMDGRLGYCGKCHDYTGDAEV